MMVHPQNSTETPSKVLLNTSEPKFRGRREKRKGGKIKTIQSATFPRLKGKGSIRINE